MQPHAGGGLAVGVGRGGGGPLAGGLGLLPQLPQHVRHQTVAHELVRRLHAQLGHEVRAQAPRDCKARRHAPWPRLLRGRSGATGHSKPSRTLPWGSGTVTSGCCCPTKMVPVTSRMLRVPPADLHTATRSMRRSAAAATSRLVRPHQARRSVQAGTCSACSRLCTASPSAHAEPSPDEQEVRGLHAVRLGRRPEHERLHRQLRRPWLDGAQKRRVLHPPTHTHTHSIALVATLPLPLKHDCGQKMATGRRFLLCLPPSHS